jgi:translation elongation factor EF-4
MKAGDKISSCHTRKKYEVTELGIMHPEEIPTESLRPGQVGYIACNMKESSEGKQSTFFSNIALYTSSSYRRHSIPCWGTCGLNAWFPAHESHGK